MKHFLKKSLLFLIGIIIVFEITIRLNYMTIELPRREITNNGIQRYKPNQSGYWIGGNPKWEINKLGWPGRLPESFDNLILLIGDSHIENFMNPNECHQNTLLKKLLPQLNFLEAGRSGVSLIEAFEISSELDSLNPLLSLLYVKESDFTESVADLGRKPDITQVNLSKSEVLYGEMKNPLLKNLLYKFKAAYYFYNKFQITANAAMENKNKDTNIDNELIIQKYEKKMYWIKELLIFCKNNYKINNFVLIFHPGTSEEIVLIARDIGFRTITFLPEYKNEWGLTKKDVSHWNCSGHKKAAAIISDSLKVMISKDFIE